MDTEPQSQWPPSIRVSSRNSRAHTAKLSQLWPTECGSRSFAAVPRRAGRLRSTRSDLHRTRAAGGQGRDRPCRGRTAPSPGDLAARAWHQFVARRRVRLERKNEGAVQSGERAAVEGRHSNEGRVAFSWQSSEAQLPFSEPIHHRH
jgi:hypothetical protein